MKTDPMSTILAQHPRPWRTEDDWTCEVLDGNGKAVTKIPLNDRWIGQLLVRLFNDTTDDTTAQAVIEAARQLVKQFCEHGVPALRKDDVLPEPYWSPSARMLDTGPVMKLSDLIAAHDRAQGERG